MGQESLQILAVGAHPDDLEILCSGTLARYAQMEHKVVMAHVLNGNKGHYRMERAELAQIRRAEAQAAGEVIGAGVIGLDVPEGEVVNGLEMRRRMVDLVRQVRPDVSITHGPDDYMADHTTVWELVRDAGFYAASPSFETACAAHDKIPPVSFMDTVMRVGFAPTEYVDI